MSRLSLSMKPLESKKMSDFCYLINTAPIRKVFIQPHTVDLGNKDSPEARLVNWPSPVPSRNPLTYCFRFYPSRLFLQHCYKTSSLNSCGSVISASVRSFPYQTISGSASAVGNFSYAAGIFWIL